MTTTAINVDDELLNRCIVLTVDESPEQTKAIQALQRQARTLDGLLHRKAREDVERLHQNAQRLFEPVAVVNPFAPELAFGSGTTRSRRDQKKLLTLIDTITFLHQHQRQVKSVDVPTGSIKYIEVTKGDIDLAVKLAGPLFTEGTEDVPPQTGKMFSMIKAMVATTASEHGTDVADVRFTRRQLRERFGWGVTQTRVHLDRLIELEHIVRHRERDGQRYLYGLPPTGSTQPGGGRRAPGGPMSRQGNGNHAEDLHQPGGVAAEAHRGRGSENSYRTRSSPRDR
jgi:DNA primase